jgi:NAD(P)-dependent dehydrogenase (short-subunit alcohol dehydrogenase family)
LDRARAFAIPHVSHDLSGQTALVTGASSGLGWRFAQVLAACGASVAVTGRRLERLQALAADIRAAGGVAEPFVMDVAQPEELAGVVDQVEAALGPVTILVNNAGIPDAQYATALTLLKADRVIDTNFRGAFVLSTEVARRMIARKAGGRMVNIASMAAFEYSGGAAALYSMTKSALVRMTEVLAVEWAKFDINVNGIAPGVFESEMTSGMLERMSDAMVGQFPRKRVCHPAQLDGALLFLVSPASECVTGTIIKVDDGQGGR